ncbi:MAG: hypothetical protein ABL904_08025, partial [Hyphomicrobiaceae bacterium]
SLRQARLSIPTGRSGSGWRQSSATSRCGYSGSAPSRRVLSKIGFEVGATPVELKAGHGDRVKKGNVAARLAVGEQEAKVAKAKAALLVSVPISARL